MDDASEEVGIEREPGPYRPHLTVGRLMHNFKVEEDEAVEAFQEFGAYEPIFWVPDSVKLVRSKFGRGGTTYTTIEEFQLAEPQGTVSDGDEDEYRPAVPTLLDFLDNSDPPGDDDITGPVENVSPNPEDEDVDRNAGESAGEESPGSDQSA